MNSIIHDASSELPGNVERTGKKGIGPLAATLILLSWIGVIVGVVIGTLVLLGGMASATGAPQEAVVICLALACAILPYCFARAVTEIANSIERY